MKGKKLNRLKENVLIKAAYNRATRKNENKRCENGANQRSYAKKNPETMNTSKRNKVGGSTLKAISKYGSQSDIAPGVAEDRARDRTRD